MSSQSDALFRRLCEDLGETAVYPDSVASEVAKDALKQAILKKFQDEISPDADSRAIALFLECNERCAAWELRCESWEDELVGCLKTAIYEFWNPCGYPLVSTPAEILQAGRTGPGASLGAYGNDFYTKMFSSPLTTTRPILYEWYSSYVSGIPEWKCAEIIRRENFGSPLVVEGSKLGTVPKRVDISRTICTEPSLNMFYQLGFGHLLEDRLVRSFGIDLSLQPDRNRELARLGSLGDGPNNPVTIDLSSASDSLACKMLEYFLPRDFYRWLVLMRSDSAAVPGQDGRVRLEMVSTMGNGFTFPLQTMLFACIVYAAAKYRSYVLQRPTRNCVGNFGVFGDDIIVPSCLARDVLRLLRICGFTPNVDKTFLEGPFRESCGSDFYAGVNVRGVYVKSLRTPQARYVAINRLNDWSARLGIPLPRTIQFLMSTVRFLPVPWHEADDAGIKLPASLSRYHVGRCRHTGSMTYRAWVSRPSYVRISDDAVYDPKRRVIYNPAGLMLAVLRGDVTRGRIMVRQTTTLYANKLRVTPHWDYTDLRSGFAPEQWQRWNAAVYANIGVYPGA